MILYKGTDTEIKFIILDECKSEDSTFWNNLQELSENANKTISKKEYVNSLRKNFRMKY